MARKTHVVLEDDLDGTPADETLEFTIDGVEYEIDLTTEHAAALREALAPWVGAARRVGGRRSARASASKGNLAEIREWARSNGLSVSDRGRISSEVQKAYADAH